MVGRGVCRGPEGGVRLGAVGQGPQGRGPGKEASFARRTGAGTEDSGCRDAEVTFRDPWQHCVPRGRRVGELGAEAGRLAGKACA